MSWWFYGSEKQVLCYRNLLQYSRDSTAGKEEALKNALPQA